MSCRDLEECEIVWERRNNGESFAEIAQFLDLSNSEARRMYSRIKYHKK